MQEYIFTTYICSMDAATMSMHGFNCFQAFFADVNNGSGVWRASGRDGQESGRKINGQLCPRVGRASGICLEVLLSLTQGAFAVSTGASFVGRRVRVLWKDEKMHNGTICHYTPSSTEPGNTGIQRHTVSPRHPPASCDAPSNSAHL